MVFYRKSQFSDLIEQAKSQLKEEKITVEAINVEQDGKDVKQVGNFMRTKAEGFLKGHGEGDVIWCMLDSVILSKALFKDFWIPLAHKTTIPILTGVRQLVEPSMEFGVFAVTPNLEDLSSQASQMLERIVKEHQNPQKIGVEQLISVDKFLDRKRANELGLKIREDRTADVIILE